MAARQPTSPDNSMMSAYGHVLYTPSVRNVHHESSGIAPTAAQSAAQARLKAMCAVRATACLAYGATLRGHVAVELGQGSPASVRSKGWCGSRCREMEVASRRAVLQSSSLPGSAPALCLETT